MAYVIRPSITGGRQLRATAMMLRTQAKGMQQELGKAVKAEGEPTLVDLRDAARKVKVVGVATPAAHKFTHGVKTKALRERMAAAAGIQIRNNTRMSSVSFIVDPNRMGTAKVIPRYIDLGKPWRHPIMGNRERWAASKGEPWFFPPIKDHLPGFRKRIEAVLDDIRRKVEES